MLVRVVLVVACSVAAFSYAHRRSNRDRSDAQARFRNPKEHKDGENKAVHTYTGVDSASKEEEEEKEVKCVSTFSPALSSKSLQESDQLLLPEFDDLFQGGLEFQSDSSADDVKVKRNDKRTVLGSCNDSPRIGEQCANYPSSDDNLDSQKYDSNSEDDEALEIFEALATAHNRSFNNFSREAAVMSISSEGQLGGSVLNNVDELIKLRTVVTELQEKELKLEAELLEYYGLKEQEESIVELERQLRKKNIEIEKLNSKIVSLEAQKYKISEELAGMNNLKKELEAARIKIKELQRQVQSDAGQTKAQLLIFKKQVVAMEEKQREASKKDFELEKKLQTLKELEIEVVELRRKNKELQHQKRELTVKLAAAEAKILELSNVTENDLVARAEAEASAMRHANEDLSKQVEGLQMNRFSEVEELVYLRWVNACLRYELRNYQAPPGMFTALDLSKNLSPKSQEKAKQLMLEYAGPDLLALKAKEHGDNDFDSISSQSSTPSEYGDFDDSSFDSGKNSGSKKSGLIRKLKKWGKSNDDSQISSSSSPSELRNPPIKTNTGHRRSNSKGTLEALMRRTSSDGAAIAMGESDTAIPISSFAHSFTARSSISPILQLSNSDSSTLQGDLLGKLEPRNVGCDVGNMEASSKVAASFHLMSSSVEGVLNNKYPAFKDRHILALEREKAIKERAEHARSEKSAEKMKVEGKTLKVPEKSVKFVDKTNGEKVPVMQAFSIPTIESTTERPEVNKMKLSEVVKRAPRVATPPPKPSAGGFMDSKIPTKVAGGAPPPPPPPPPHPAAPGAPPPPPPLPHASSIRLQDSSGTKVQRAPEVVEFYQSLMRRETRKDSGAAGPADYAIAADVHHDMIGEIENRSAFLLAVKADVETQGDFVESLATEVRAAAYTNIEDVVAFVNWLDEELCFLVDDRAVLKHFDWPESKADAFREAAFEYQDLKKLEFEISSYEDDAWLPCDSALKKMFSLLEKVEQSVYALLRTRDMAAARYKDFNIPTNWMLDSGLIGKIKLASMQLAGKYMKRVASELDAFVAVLEKEPLREFLLLQGVRFAFRVHQFAGGFDAETMCAFEDLRNRVHAHSRDNERTALGNTEAA